MERKRNGEREREIEGEREIERERGKESKRKMRKFVRSEVANEVRVRKKERNEIVLLFPPFLLLFLLPLSLSLKFFIPSCS